MTHGTARLRRDWQVLLAGVFLRAVGTSLAGIELGYLLAARQLNATQAGEVVSAGLLGAACSAGLATAWADRAGRRRTLVLVSLAGAAGTVGACLSTSGGMLALAAFVGMLNGMGRDRGAALVVEQAILPGLATDVARTRMFAWYNVLQDLGHALGSLLAGLPALLGSRLAMPETSAHATTLSVNAVALVTCACLAAALSPAVEPPVGASRSGLSLSPASRGFVARVAGLFLLDSLGSGFLTASLLAWFFFERFHASSALVGALFASARLLNAGSHMAAAWLASRIGLVRTMVFTHLPSSLLLVTVAFAPTLPIAAALFLLRESLVEMDVPTRQSYVMAVVAPDERLTVSGLTNLVRLVGWALTPLLAGRLMQHVSLGAPLALGAGTKIAYDLLLWRAFRRVRPPEECRPPAAPSTA